ncbi:hypothetical protein ACFYE2_00495 [Kocuria sp. CPCC 205300]|uniref:hypothetical protein n=1 Tax=Kocuria sabuli TaxID=3071448 RepID=UPI0036DAB947
MAGSALANLVSLADYRAAVNPPRHVTDAQLEQLLSAASAKVRRYCGWHIAPVVTDHVVVDGPGTNTVMLPTMRLLEVKVLTENGMDVPLADLEWSEDGYLRKYHGAAWTGRLRGLKATILHGHDDLPDLEQVVIDVVARASLIPTGITQESTGSSAVSYAGDGAVRFMAPERETLNMYRVRS